MSITLSSYILYIPCDPSLQIALQLVRQGVSNEPALEAVIVTPSVEPTDGGSATIVKDEKLNDPAVKDPEEAKEPSLKETLVTEPVLSTDTLSTPEVV